MMTDASGDSPANPQSHVPLIPLLFQGGGRAFSGAGVVIKKRGAEPRVKRVSHHDNF